MADVSSQFVRFINNSTPDEVIKSLKSVVTSLSDCHLTELTTLIQEEASSRKRRESDSSKRRSQADETIANAANGSLNKKHKSEPDAVDPLLELIGESVSPVKKEDFVPPTSNVEEDFDDLFDENSEEDRFAILATSGITFSESGLIEDCSRSSGENGVTPHLKPLDEILTQKFSQEMPMETNGSAQGAETEGFKKASGQVISVDLSKGRAVFKGIDLEIEDTVKPSGLNVK